MSISQSKIQQVEQIIKTLDLRLNSLSSEDELSLLIQACDYIEMEMKDFTGDLHFSRKLLAYILANRIYEFGFNLMIKLDYVNSTIEQSFHRAYQIAKFGYTPNDKRLKKFIDRLLSIAVMNNDLALTAQLNKELALVIV